MIPDWVSAVPCSRDTDRPTDSMKSRRTVSARSISWSDSECHWPRRRTRVVRPTSQPTRSRRERTGTGTAAKRCQSIRAPTFRKVLSRSTHSSTTVMKKPIVLSLNRTP